MSVLGGLRHHQSALWQLKVVHINSGASLHYFDPLRPRGSRDRAVACVPVWHGVWKTSEPLSDLDQWLNIAKHDPNVNAE